jgi:two-component system, response regulator PdtaR
VINLQEIRAACPDAILQRPYLPQAIDVAIVVALDHFSYGKRMRTRVARMEESIRSMRDIERAKQIIMARSKVDEGEAFRVLREMAMTKRVTVAAIAAKLVDSAETAL